MLKAYIIRGRVQGVFFRKYTKEKAMELGLCGYVKNQADGSVYCCAQGPEEAMRQFEQFLQNGSPLARVESVEEPSAVPEILSADFQIH